MSLKNRDTFDKNSMARNAPTYGLRKGIVMTALAVFVIHFSMIVMHCMPDSYLPARWRSYSHWYAYPMFHQGWGLFAPEPQKKYKRLEFAYAQNGEWSEWIHPEQRFENAHFSYRLGPYSKLYHVNQGVGFHLWRDWDNFGKQQQPAELYYPKQMGYGVAGEYAKAFAHHFLVGVEPDSIRIRIILFDPPTGALDSNFFPVYIPE
jgi:hypothetical protein